MQNLLQNVQYKYQIYNSDIEPEHDTDYYCGCAIHQYNRRKMSRLGVQEMWSKAVMYPGKHICDSKLIRLTIYSVERIITSFRREGVSQLLSNDIHVLQQSLQISCHVAIWVFELILILLHGQTQLTGIYDVDTSDYLSQCISQ